MRRWWLRLLARENAPIWLLVLVGVFFVALIAGGETVALWVAGVCRDDERGLLCVREWQTLLVGLTATAATLLAAWITIRAIRRQIDAGNANTQTQVDESKRQFAHQMRVATAKDRAMIDRATRPRLAKLEQAERSLRHLLEVRSEREATDEENRGVTDKLRELPRFKGDDWDSVDVLLGAAGRKAIEWVIQRGDAVRSRPNEATIAEIESDDWVEAVLDEISDAKSAIAKVNDEVRAWVGVS